METKPQVPRNLIKHLVFASYGAGIVFKDALDSILIGGFPLGFWMAQQGAIYVFVVLIFVYVRLMNTLEKNTGLGINRR